MVLLLLGSSFCNPLALVDISLFLCVYLFYYSVFVFVYFIRSLKYFYIISYPHNKKVVPSHCVNLKRKFLLLSDI